MPGRLFLGSRPTLRYLALFFVVACWNFTSVQAQRNDYSVLVPSSDDSEAETEEPGARNRIALRRGEDLPEPSRTVTPPQPAEPSDTPMETGASQTRAPAHTAQLPGEVFSPMPVGPLDCQQPIGPAFCRPRVRCRGPWVRLDYLSWWMRGFDSPPLVTTAPNDTPREEAGVLGFPTTSVLLGGERAFADDERSGGRITFGAGLDRCGKWGVEAVYLALENASYTGDFASGGDPILARPFFNVEPGFVGEDAELIAFPDQFEGAITVLADSDFRSFELLVRRAVCCDPCLRIDVLGGWRYSQLDESLLISDFRNVLSGEGGLVIGTTIAEEDFFRTENTFSGFELGAVAEVRHRCWTLELLMKLALGNNSSDTTISGSTVTEVPIVGADPDVDVRNTGLLAQQSNIGRYHQDEFAMIPELGVTLGYDIRPRLRVTVGYTFLYWSQVLRPGDQIDRTLNLSQLDGPLVGPTRPVVTPLAGDVWVQGLNLGLFLRY